MKNLIRIKFEEVRYLYTGFLLIAEQQQTVEKIAADDILFFLLIQYNFGGSNTADSFTTAVSNSFLSP